MAGSGKRPQSSTSTALGRLANQTQQDFELEFFAGILDHHPEYVEALKVHAKNLAQAKRHDEGVEFDSRITHLRPTDSLAHYNLACSYALTRRLDEALEALRRAVELGYRDFTFIQQDRDLDPVRKDPRFRAILREFKSR
ncbi:TPR end-of-group domain-containing protein [Zavarzinella formosa]|uniref:TPR end-of-group domain-containing protein n=1 Tax=Zavarzinella formosa TaxID=360055 RepID=UPI0002DE2203|nr:tetratricopeptide repeat protein [Zavarzinella formosa]